MMMHINNLASHKANKMASNLTIYVSIKCEIMVLLWGVRL